MSKKLCTKCGEPRELEQFCHRKNAKDGRASQCKLCDKNYRTEHLDETNARNRHRYKTDSKYRSRVRVRETLKMVRKSDELSAFADELAQDPEIKALMMELEK